MSDFECPECGESFDRRRTMHSHAAQLHGDEFTDEMPWRDENTLIELYHGEQMNTQEIADELGCAATTIRKWMDRNNIEARSMSEVWQIIEHPHKSGRHNTPEELLDGEWLREQYHDLEKNAAEIAEMLECTEGTVRRWRDKHGIERRSMDDILRAKYTPDVLLDKEWLREEYVNKERTAMDIADDLECTFITVSRWVREHGIEHRNYWTPSGTDHPEYKEDKDHPSYGPNWGRTAAAVRKRDDQQCQRCGMGDEEHKEQFGCSLTVHHITPLREFKQECGIDYSKANDESNLIALCLSCHGKLEGVPIDTRAKA